ncbi:MAG: serine/threonine protein kinase [Deltaproteobacteria bacterium]|nr:serine/threonine protein kinase [Deltaproteobacteria bacterium]MBK8714480.1 serine/threonine protein kinase [Deltaproteobacteria bacterium]MBP7288240.1 serine/threonine protein kinase [Nannocystaceae bacterium]
MGRRSGGAGSDAGLANAATLDADADADANTDADNDADADADVESWLVRLAAAPEVPLTLVPGASIGTSFRIERELGRGAMGVVFLAHHLVLDRKVAIKIHRARSAFAADRLLREARALARVEHEHVITVHEAGAWEDQVLIAMEYVDGWTARQWAELEPRSWREIVALYCKAGRGLQAAHERGLIHRDFKPDNILVGRDGRVRVADFGLARIDVDDAEQRARSVDSIASSETSAPAATAGLVGSPAYMAPEQYRTAAVTAAADQFGFCVSLFEALSGTRPFDGDSVDTVAAAICAGRARELPPQHAPAHIRAALRRGMAVDDAQRFPDMAALVAELERDPGRTRRRTAAAIGVVGLVALGGWQASTWRADRAVDECGDPTAELIGVWDPSRREAIQTAMVVDDDATAPARFEAIATAIDDYAARWGAEWQQGCTRPAVHACLVSARGRLSALLQFLERAGPQALLFAPSAVTHLADPVLCAQAVEGGGTEATEATNFAGALAELTLRVEARRDPADLAELERLARDAEAAQEFRVASQALSLAGRLLDDAEAEPLLRRSATLAVSGGNRDDMAIAWSLSAATLAELGRLDEAAAQLELAQGAARDITELATRASVANNAGIVLARLRRAEEAIASFREAIDLNTQVYGPQHESVAESRTALAIVFRDIGRLDEARTEAETALAILGTSVGDRHPLFANTQGVLGAVCLHAGERECAERALTAAAAVFGDVLGRRGDGAWAGIELAGLRLQQGRLDDAIALLERMLAQVTAESRPPSKRLGELLGNVGLAYAMRGDAARALEFSVRSRDVFAAVMGNDHRLVVSATTNVGNLQRELGRLDASAASLTAAVEQARRILQPTDPMRLNAEIELGITSLVQGDSVRALSLARGVLAIVPEDEPTVHLAEARFLLARALGRSSTEGREAARQSLAVYRRLGEGVAGQAALVEAWLEPDDRE